MKIGLIGYKNQGSKIANIVLRKKKLNNLLIYHPRKNFEIKRQITKNKKIHITNTINDLFTCDAVFIASPSDTHVFYIKKLIYEKPIIFCEKPCSVNLKGLNYLKKLKKKYKKKVFFNFHLPETPVFKKIINIISSPKKYGDLISIDIYNGRGLAFKPKFKNNWRFKNKNLFNNILGNLGIHYIHFLSKISKKNKIIKIQNENFSRLNKSFDTSEILFQLNKNIYSKVFISYSTPFINTVKIIFTNSVIFLNNNKLLEFRPRDTYDLIGNFKQPMEKTLINISPMKNLKIGLEKNIDIFLSAIIKKNILKVENFDLAIYANETLLRYYKKNKY